MESFRHITIECRTAEEDSYEIHDLGALGIEIIDDNHFLAFLPDESEAIKRITDACTENGWKYTLSDSQQNQNWVQRCEEIWQPITVGKFTIQPILNASSAEQTKENSILIIPGEGFGTGHHPSTRLVIDHLQHIPVNAPKTAFDFGTGNGILAIAAALQFPQTTVLAIDNDAAAVANAAENVECNQLQGRIELRVASIEEIHSIFDLICANIYAEVLCNYSEQMYSALSPNGYLILAGIQQIKAPLIKECFIAPRWSIIRETDEDGWSSFLLQKVA